MANLDELRKCVIEGDRMMVSRLTKQALEANSPVKEILDKALVPGLQKVGDLFEKGEYFLPELIVSGKAVAEVLELLKPMLIRDNVPAVGKFLIGTVTGDVHDLGKNIVIMMLRGNGWEVTDLGVDVSPEDFCSAVDKGDFQILGLSALLTMTTPEATRTIEALKVAGLREKVNNNGRWCSHDPGVG